MDHKKERIIVIVLVLFCANTRVWASGYEFFGTGIRALSMGGAFMAKADDATATYWNPAGLGQLKGKGITLLDVRSLIKHNVRPARGVSVDEVVRRISQYYDVPEKSIYEKTRKKEVVKPRQIIMYVLREEFNVSYPSIGEKLGGRDHTTVIHSCEKIKEELKSNTSLEQELDHVRALIRA